jgi:hypothetical protein
VHLHFAADRKSNQGWGLLTLLDAIGEGVRTQGMFEVQESGRWNASGGHWKSGRSPLEMDFFCLYFLNYVPSGWTCHTLDAREENQGRNRAH